MYEVELYVRVRRARSADEMSFHEAPRVFGQRRETVRNNSLGAGQPAKRLTRAIIAIIGAITTVAQRSIGVATVDCPLTSYLAQKPINRETWTRRWRCAGMLPSTAVWAGVVKVPSYRDGPRSRFSHEQVRQRSHQADKTKEQVQDGPAA